ncbi:MAG TPA: UrcA family protein [Xanthomonadales bacterium]|nr:UrcA family protein [Xanthomonadales bacterium]
MNAIVHNRRLSFGRMLLLGIAAALPLATQAGEPASSQLTVSSVVVSYADLDLNNPAGARTLYARLNQAAKKVCGHRPPPMELHALKLYQSCFDSTLNKAVKRVDSQQLYALHAERSRQSTVG